MYCIFIVIQFSIPTISFVISSLTHKLFISVLFNFLWFGVMIDISNYFIKLPLTFDLVWDNSKPIVCLCLLPPATSWQSLPTHRPHKHMCTLAVPEVSCWVDSLSNLILAGLPFHKTSHTYYSLFLFWTFPRESNPPHHSPWNFHFYVSH